ncbi:sigma-w pathway protein ysdB [Mesobacillus foraminis]|uniref:sigma-w pathway protein ysdB n=1 Tax=Mesobacillus foraminis TaxID=279826 RepID=UPI001BE7ACAE|nr:sigma-w pathway protein ysdB [Mesobacillus foraminis]MBT2754501.1 sigma-w pathway protein ysdB [Mesobacillus foraminis]
MLWILRLILFASIIFLLYRTVRYLLHPKRKLELAHEQKRFFLLDDQENVRKNFLVTYKGVMFEGEKYLGTTEYAFEVVSIFMWPKNSAALKGLSYEDFLVIENEVHELYPGAAISWKSPVKEFMEKQPEL